MGDRAVETIVVAYGYDESLERCVAEASSFSSVCIVDNSSMIEIAELASRFGASYDDPGENLGFAAGVNRGLRRVDLAADVLLLNPDAFVTSEAVSHMRAELTDRRIAVVAPRLIGADGAEQRVEWPFPSPGRAWRQAFLAGRGRKAPSFLVGAVLLIRREALDDVGAFDERFFLYAEETDWQRRAWLKGWRALVCEQARADHYGAGTSTDARRREALFHSGNETYIRKWFGAGGWQAFRAASILRELLRLPVARDRRARMARVMLYVRGPRRVAGLDT